mmetsp:Transcript_17171/g.25699  ORF Transcript_17171/g.25699 Transcript_17171/m.25699 type:complete len:121 (+) Transcript_17171:204-566(+)
MRPWAAKASEPELADGKRGLQLNAASTTTGSRRRRRTTTTTPSQAAPRGMVSAWGFVAGATGRSEEVAGISSEGIFGGKKLRRRNFVGLVLGRRRKAHVALFIRRNFVGGKCQVFVVGIS